MSEVRNPFRIRFLRQNFDAAVTVYKAKGRTLFYPDGSRCKGNSWATNFWRGFDNTSPGRWDRDGKQTAAYAMWRAGRAMAQTEEPSDV